MSFKTSKIIESISRRAMLPDNESTFTEADFLDMVDDELRYFAVPHILSAKEEYLITYEEITLVEGQLSYTIPYRSVGSIVRDVAVVETSGVVRELSRIELDDISNYSSRYNSGAYPGVFYLEGDQIKFPYQFTIPQGSILRVYFPLAPNKLVTEKEVGTIADINRTTGVITLSNFPDKYADLPLFDFIKERNPNNILDYDISAVSANKNAKTVEFAVADIPANLVVGDHLAIAGETMVLQLPTEFQKVVCQRVAVQALEALGDAQNLTMAQGRLEQMEKATLQLIINRVEGAPIKISPRRSILRNTQNRRYKNDRGN